MSRTTISIGGGPEIPFEGFTQQLPENHLLKALARHSADDLVSSLTEREAEILEDIQTTRQELEEGKPLVFSFSFSGKLLLDKNKIETAFSYSVKKTCKGEHGIPNPDEPEFEFESREEAA